MVNIVHGNEELLFEARYFTFESLNFSLEFVLKTCLVLIVVVVFHQVSAQDLDGLLEGGDVQKVDVEDSWLVDVSLTQEAGYVFEETAFSETWHTEDLDDVVLG